MLPRQQIVSPNIWNFRVKLCSFDTVCHVGQNASPVRPSHQPSPGIDVA